MSPSTSAGSEGFDGVLSLCAARGAALVSGTTALTDAQEAAMDAAATHVPILWASNFSLGVAVLANLVATRRTRAAGLGLRHRRSAPHAQARCTIGNRAHPGIDRRRSRARSPRYASLRAGDIVGEHTVQFTTDGERIELIHRATNRDIFARGALAAALWLSGRHAGRYALEDLFD